MFVRKRLGLELVLVGLVIALGAVAWDLSYVAEQGVGEPDQQHDEGAIMAHNLAATVVVVLGVVLAALGARMLLLERPATRNAYALFAASTLMFADGILHFFVVSEHLATLPFAVFFVIAGAVQLGLGFQLFRASPRVYFASVLVMAALVVAFFASRLVAPPFADEPEPVESLGVVSKVLEIAAIGALAFLLYRWRAETKSKAGAKEPLAP